MVAAAEPRITHIERLVAAIDLPIGRWDRDARLVFCNDHYIAWAGRPREQLLGKSLQELFGEPAWAVAAPAFAQAFENRTVTYQRQLAHGPASGRWVRIQVCPDADASGQVESVFTLATDIHDDMVAREALVAAQIRLDRFTDNIPYPLTYLDRDFVLRFVNKAYTEMIGTPRDQLIGRHIGQVRGPRLWAEHEPYFQRALQGHAVQYTRLARSLPQGARWLRTSYVPDLDAAGAVVGLYTVTVDVHELAVTQEKLKRRVEHDPLTDVLSRRTLMDRVETAVADAARQTIALYFVDLDGFKAVNDRLGHREGDALLVAVGAALQAAVRAEDAVGRFGGDEFLVMARVRDAEGAHALALHMLGAIQSIAGSGPLAGVVSASIGYALAPGDARHPLNLLQLADDAMYAAKRLGKNRAMHCGAIPFEATR
ncbi:MAG: diguanylate cyclase [Rhizobiales bacterium]|nr:diguanylate cyclase [Rhizobacter sp.]